MRDPRPIVHEQEVRAQCRGERDGGAFPVIERGQRQRVVVNGFGNDRQPG